MYDNEYKTKENENWTKVKIEPQQLYCDILSYFVTFKFIIIIIILFIIIYYNYLL